MTWRFASWVFVGLVGAAASVLPVGCTGSHEARDADGGVGDGGASDAPIAIDGDVPVACPPAFQLLPSASGGGHYVSVVESNRIADATNGAPILGDVASIPGDGADAGTPSIAALAIDDARVVFVVVQGSDAFHLQWELRSALLDGSAITVLASGAGWLSAIALDGHTVLWVEGGTVGDGGSETLLRARDEAGASPARIVVTLPIDAGLLAVTADDAYLASRASVDGGNDDTDVTVWAVPRGGGAPRVFTTARNLGIFRIHEGVAYFTEDTHGSYPVQSVESTLRALPLGGGDASTLLAAERPAIADFRVTEHNLYWVSIGIQYPETPNDEWYLKGMPLAGGPAKTIASHPSTYDPYSDVPALFGEGAFLVWARRSDGVHIICD